MILLENGGPHLTSPEHNDPRVDIQQPLIIVNATSQTYHLTGAYWALAHFGRFVKRGARRIESVGGQPNLPHVAFQDEKGLVTLQIANDYPTKRTIDVSWENEAHFSFEMPPISMVTFQFDANK